MTDLEIYRSNIAVWNRRLGTSVPIPKILSPACKDYRPRAVALAKCLKVRGAALPNNVLITLASLVCTQHHAKEWGGLLAEAVSQSPQQVVEAYTLVAECYTLLQVKESKI